MHRRIGPAEVNRLRQKMIIKQSYSRLKEFGLIGVWISFAVSCLVPIGVIAIACRGNVERFFEMKGHTYLTELSLDISNISTIVESVIGAVKDAGFSKEIANRTVQHGFRP